MTPWYPVPWWAFWRHMVGDKWFRWVDFRTEWEVEYADDRKLARIYLEENFGDA